MEINLFKSMAKGLCIKKHQLFSMCDDKVFSIRCNNSNFLQKHYRFVSYNQLVSWTNEWIRTFDFPIDAVIGIPRSGLLVASIIATKLGKPMLPIEFFIDENLSSGFSLPKTIKNILIVDENTNSGETLKNLLKKINHINRYKKVNFRTGSTLLISETETYPKKYLPVDHFYKKVSPPFLFEWSLPDIRNADQCRFCSDMDGVICENCEPLVDANEKEYVNWLKNAKPYIIPQYTVDTIISNRLEKYRRITEDWLAKHHVKYKHLELWDIRSKEMRKNNFSKRKIEIIKKLKPDVFFESSLSEAKDIYIHTSTPVLCIDNMIMFS